MELVKGLVVVRTDVLMMLDSLVLLVSICQLCMVVIHAIFDAIILTIMLQ